MSGIESEAAAWLLHEAQEFLSPDIDHADVSADHDAHRSHPADDRYYDEHHHDGYDRRLLARLEREIPGAAYFLTGDPEQDFEMVLGLVQDDYNYLRRLSRGASDDLESLYRDYVRAFRSLDYGDAELIMRDGVVTESEFETFLGRYLGMREDLRANVLAKDPRNPAF